MAQQTELQVTRREILGKATKRLRKAGIIPANIFGHKEESQAVQIDATAFERLQRSHSTRNMLTLLMADGSSTQTALIRHIQRDPRTGKVVHVNFFRVSMDERLNVRIPLHFVGEAPAVKSASGVLLHLLDTIEVECKASDIPEYLEVDVTSLTEIDDILHAEDVKLPEHFTLITDPKDGVAKVAGTRAEKDEEEAEAATTPATPATPTSSAEGATGSTAAKS